MGHNGFAIILKRGDKWFPITDDEDFIHEFDTAEEARAFTRENPLCATAQTLMIVDLHAMEVV
jgi:hypothetical protein